MANISKNYVSDSEKRSSVVKKVCKQLINYFITGRGRTLG